MGAINKSIHLILRNIFGPPRLWESFSNYSTNQILDRKHCKCEVSFHRLYYVSMLAVKQLIDFSLSSDHMGAAWWMCQSSMSSHSSSYQLFSRSRQNDAAQVLSLAAQVFHHVNQLSLAGSCLWVCLFFSGSWWPIVIYKKWTTATFCKVYEESGNMRLGQPISSFTVAWILLDHMWVITVCLLAAAVLLRYLRLKGWSDPLRCTCLPRAVMSLSKAACILWKDSALLKSSPTSSGSSFCFSWIWTTNSFPSSKYLRQTHGPLTHYLWLCAHNHHNCLPTW